MMRYSISGLAVIPCVWLLSACSITPVKPAYPDIGTRLGQCVAGGPDTVAQQFYDYRIQHPTNGLNDLSALRPYLSDGLSDLLDTAARQPNTSMSQARYDLFSSADSGIDSADVASASTIPDTDARNIPLRVTFTKGSRQWQDEVLMIRAGHCWAVDDVRYLGASQAPSGSLRQSLSR